MKNKHALVLALYASVAGMVHASQSPSSVSPSHHSESHKGYDALVLLDQTWQKNQSIEDAKEIYRRLHGSHGIAAPATDDQRKNMIEIAERNAKFFVEYPDVKINFEIDQAIKSAHPEHFKVVSSIYQKSKEEYKPMLVASTKKEETKGWWSDVLDDENTDPSLLTNRIEQAKLEKAAREEKAKGLATANSKEAIRPAFTQWQKFSASKVGSTAQSMKKMQAEIDAHQAAIAAKDLEIADLKAKVLSAPTSSASAPSFEIQIKGVKTLNVSAADAVTRLQGALTKLEGELRDEKNKTHKVHNADLTGVESARLAHALIQGVSSDDSWKPSSTKKHILDSAATAGFVINLPDDKKTGMPTVDKKTS